MAEIRAWIANLWPILYFVLSCYIIIFICTVKCIIKEHSDHFQSRLAGVDHGNTMKQEPPKSARHLIPSANFTWTLQLCRTAFHGSLLNKSRAWLQLRPRSLLRLHLVQNVLLQSNHRQVSSRQIQLRTLQTPTQMLPLYLHHVHLCEHVHAFQRSVCSNVTLLGKVVDGHKQGSHFFNLGMAAKITVTTWIQKKKISLFRTQSLLSLWTSLVPSGVWPLHSYSLLWASVAGPAALTAAWCPSATRKTSPLVQQVRCLWKKCRVRRCAGRAWPIF